MTGEEAKQLDYGIAMSVQALIRAMGMQAENEQRKARGETIDYTEEHFLELIDELGIHHNAVLTRWTGI